MKKRTLTTMAIVTLILGSTLFIQAQQRQGNNGTQTPIHTGTLITISGTVVDFTAAAGAETPTLVVSHDGVDQTFALGPYRIIVDQKFAASPGDLVSIEGIECPDCPNGFVVYGVENVSAGLTLVLRDENGVPTWTGQRGRGMNRGGGNGPGSGMQGRGGNGNCTGTCSGDAPEMSRVTTVTGNVVSFTGGAGQGQPTLVLDSSTTLFLVSPYRTIARSGLTLTAGMNVSVTAAPKVVDGDEEWVVISLTDLTTGLTIRLRDAETGLPFTGRNW